MPINNSTLPSREEYLRKKRKKKIIRYVLVFLGFVTLVALTSYGAHRKEIRISKVILNGGVLIKQSDIGEKSLEFMSGSYMWLYPKNVSFWYQRHNLEKYLEQNFKRIDTVHIRLDDLNTMIVEIEERKPFAIWCESLPTTVDVLTEDNSPKCYFLDQNSTIFSEAPYFSGDAYFKYYGGLSTTTPIGNYYMASSTEFEEVYAFIDSVRKMSIHPQYLVAKDNGDFSLVVSGGGEIYFDTKKPLTEVAQNLESLLRTPALSTSTNMYLPIEYIDLRYGNKLFYKLKGESI